MIEWLTARAEVFMLLACRPMGLFITAPVFANRFVPLALRVALSLAVALVVLPLAPTLPGLDAPPGTAGGLPLTWLLPLAVQELLVGMIIGFAAALVFVAVQLAGELIDTDMGFSIVNTIDPSSGTQLPLVGNFKYILALLIFLSISGHHVLLWALVESYHRIPPASLVLTPDSVGSVVRMTGGIFRSAVLIAAPAMAALFLTSIALGAVARAVPQMNVFVVGLPVRIGVGIFILAVALPMYVALLQGMFDRMYTDLLALMDNLGGTP